MNGGRLGAPMLGETKKRKLKKLGGASEEWNWMRTKIGIYYYYKSNVEHNCKVANERVL